MNTLLDLLRDPFVDAPASAESDTASDCFWAHGSLPAESLSVEIEGFGALAHPLPATEAQTLQALGEPARFGLREQTLIDTAVRHTGEVSADRVSLEWRPGRFDAFKHEVARALCVARLDAWLHNLLIYGPGQFFKPHQDTETCPGMVATLVLIWPSPHIGGALRVEHASRHVELASQHLQTIDLRWFAFYADCRHEVLPVSEGWRIALTFDLVLPVAAERLAVPAALSTQLQAALRERFALDDTPSLAPQVLLLDHEYTEHGLRWPLLKAADRWRVAALRAAAESLGLHVHLALAELHQTWTASPAPRSRGQRFTDDDGHPEPNELIDESLSLDFWVDAQDKVGPRSSLPVSLDQTISFTETGPAHLVDEEYEGYMGNYGETLDYWYRRAALVIQTPMSAERSRFQLDFDAALATARGLTKDPDASATLLGRVRVAMRLLTAAAAARGRSLLGAYAEIASALPDADVAMALMSSFDPRTLIPEDAAVAAALERLRGTPWTRALLQGWFGPSPGRPDMAAGWRPGWGTSLAAPRLWPDALPVFTRAALDAGWSGALMSDWFDACRAALSRFDQARAQARPANRMQLLTGQLRAACELAQSMRLRGQEGEDDLKALIDELLTRPSLYPPEQLASFVQSAGPLCDHWPQRRNLRSQVVDALQAALSEPERDAANHHLHGIEWTCRCKDCAGMIVWAESSTAVPLVMAMAEPRRRHVQAELEAAGAPLFATTLKQGSPHRLVLSKPDDLLARDQAVRERRAGDLAMLQA